MARCYGIDRPLLYRWIREPTPPPQPVFLEVTMSDGADAVGAAFHQSAVPVIVERPRDEIEVERLQAIIKKLQRM